MRVALPSAVPSATEIGPAVDELELDFGLEFDRLVANWVAEQSTSSAEYNAAEYSEAQGWLDALLEARAVMAAMQAREQECLARLEEIALEEAGPHASGLNQELAWRSMVAEVAVATRQADRTVQVQFNLARRLLALPKVSDALARGRISIQHARVIAEHSIGLSAAGDAAEARGGALAEYEELALTRAEATTPGKLASTARALAARLQQEPFEERAGRASEDRCVEIRELEDGMSQLVHTLPTVFASAIFDRLTRQAKAVSAAGDARSRDQLRSDLAVELLLNGEPLCDSATPLSAARGIRAQVSIVIPALTLLGKSARVGSGGSVGKNSRSGEAWLPDESLVFSGENLEAAALAGRGPIDLETAALLAAHAPELVRVITHPISGVIITADTYRPTASLRRYLEQRDRHCRFPSCNRDATWCDIDHTIAWEDGGKTEPGNLEVLCRGHHTLKHNSKWKVEQVAPGVLEWTSPLGHPVRAGPD
ncbi:MAG: DUF222 domain-containing protein [Cryobacterium sp.]|nr:DUF222 domain-containing protein [Cryobacterium sp.]MBX3116245.1 DUF222 domain-containing protein [Cryobacterium sp.]MCO5294008.1 HNH endonuclease [Homoserinimonas sp.]